MSDSDITAELKRVGLDHPPGYWSKVFQDELGVTSVEALGLVGGESYHNLKQFVKHPWEKKALRTLLDIKEEESAFKKQRESQLEKMNERYKKASELLTILKEERSKCKDRSDQMVKDLENAAREMLQVSPAAWISKDESLSGLITHLEHLQDGIGSQLKKRGDVEDITVLKTASGGRALLGVIHSKNLEDQLSVPENYLLKIPESVQLLSASHSRKDITEQFSSQHQEDCFSKTVDELGYSVAVAAKASGFWGVTVEGSVAVSRKTSEENTGEQHEQQQYCSTMKYSFVPLASFAFTDSQLQLSEDALGDLKYIEEVLVTYTPASPNTQQACKNFFKKFGSHANRGPLHFGGIYWLKSSTKAFKHSEMTVLKQFQCDAVNVQVSISHVIGVGASSEVDVTSVKEKYNGRCSKSTMSQTVMQLDKTGGPPEASTLPEWKTGLVASNNTWNLIDRGTNFVPVWEIIRMNHSEQFGKVRELIDVLKKTWEKMTNENAEPDFETPSYSRTDVMKEVSTWNPKEDASGLKEKLEYLIEVKEDLIKVSINPQAWSSLYLSQEPLQHFLKSVVEQQQSAGAEKAHIKLLMTQLVEKADLNRLKLTNFPCKVLSQWMYGKIAQPQSLLPLECSDFLSFKKYLEAALEAMNEAKARSMPTGFVSSRSAPQDSYISIATSAVGKAVNSFERNLQECNQRYEHLFLLTMLYPFKYGTSYQPVILKQMSASDLQYLTELLQTKCDDFFKVKSKSLTKTQVFLFHLTIEICLNGSQIDMDEHLALKHLKYLVEKIGEDLESPVQDMLTKFYSSSDVDLEELQTELYAALFSEDIHQQETGPSLMSVLDSVKKKTQEDQSTMDTSVIQSAAQECNNPEAEHLFRTLDLMRSYPQKLTLRDALSIRKDTLGNVECNDPSRVYMFLLQKIMAYDCQCRSNILQEENVLTTSSEKDELFGDDFEDEDTQDPESTIKVHPMDSFLALILCADDFLRQDLLARLVDCQLSIPLILPDPFTKQLSFPLWAMRSIVKEWKHRMVDGSIKTLEAPLVSYRAPIISFIRFTTQEKSKSEMLNSVISDSNHNHFFHHDCEGGNFNQFLGNGLVDMCWYLPAGKMDDRFPGLITFMNLHGNALEHPQQVAFLSKVSFMTFVLFTEEDVNEESTKVLQQLSTAPGGIVMLLCGRSIGKLKQLSKSIPKDRLQGLNLMQSARNADGIKKEIRERINAKLQKLWDAVSLESRKLEECVEVAVKHNIIVDERKKEFLQAQEMAHTLQKMLTSHTDEDISAKEKMLPLQGEHLWQKWAAQDKEEHRQVNRGGMRFEVYSSRKQKEKTQIRKLQLQHVQHLNPLMENFIKSLLSTSGSVRNYFLQCLKLYLNDHSGNTIATWQKQYRELRSLLLTLEKERKPCKDVLHRIEILHKKIINASLGLEHLLRELGQVYEAVQEAPRCIVGHRQEFSQLPKVAAELLIDGYPLELMDGDAAHVPKTWVSAVLEEMTKLLNNPRLFVLSVLGLQSTGKSTLINTTFGLQFNVSAGRCTRGAFMQLLPISAELTHETKCDYILIVDTEGLRAPELDYQKMQQHDNELATFVIGLANVTMINIYGQTPGDMDDILQTSVHAFIRMKAVRMQFKPSCQFVHQNVAAVGASGKGGMGRAKFKDKLNRMTFEAAREEKCEGIQYFSDVIHFDEENDVHHFPGLWKGDPPMAPVNPGYSDKALSLKSHLVQSVQQSKELQKLSDIHMQIKDLWNALLHEKFVFSFKNTLELSVYRSLETKYIQWAGRFRTKMLEWEQNARNEIKNSPPDQLKALEHKLLEVKLPAEVTELRNVLEAELSAYFEENDQREMLAQWQSETTNRLKRLERQLKDQAKDHCLELISSQQACETINNMRTNYQEQLMKKVRLLVSSLPRKQLTDSDSNTEEQALKLRKTFDEEWGTWIQDLTKNAPVHREEIDVELSVQQSLIELYKSEEQHVREKLKKPLSEWGSWLHLPLKEEHATIKVKESTYAIGRKLREVKDMVLGKSGPEPAISNPTYKHQAELNTKAVFDTTEEYLCSIENENFHPSFTDELLGQIKKGIDEDDHTGFVYTKDYYLDLSLTACGYAAKKFRRMRETFLKENDPIEYLEREMKTPLFTLFKNQYFQIAGEKMAACTFCDLITGCIKKQVLDLLGPMIFEDMRTLPHLATKSALKARILIDLGEELQKTGNTHDYFVHLKNVARSYRKWLTHYAKEYCRECKGGKQSRLVLLAHQKLNTLVRLVSKQVDEVTEENKHEDGIETKKWLSCICSQLASTLQMDVFSGFQDLGGVQRLKDAENFTEEIHKGLQVIQIGLQDSLNELTLDDLKAKPYDLLYDLLSGCTEQCPFCKEQCDCTNDDHTVKHSVQQHRPMCLKGTKWHKTREMSTDMCNYSVGSDNQFRNKDTGNEWFPYKRFQEKYPRWSITVDMSAESSLYWKWFVGNYSGEIAAYHGIKDNDIPRAWKKYTWEEARAEVTATYKF